MFTASLIPEPFLEFRDREVLRNPRRGILNFGPFDFSSIPTVRVCFAVDQSIKEKFDSFWRTVIDGDRTVGYKGFYSTFGSEVESVGFRVYNRTSKLTDWIKEITADLSDDTVTVGSFRDKDINENYENIKANFAHNRLRVQLIKESTLEKLPLGHTALSVGTAVYAKAGGTPWRLQDPVAPGGLFLGISFARPSESHEIYYGVIEVFDKYGKLIEARARSYRKTLERTKGLYVPYEDLSEYLSNLKSRQNPLFFIVHKSGAFHRDEIRAFEESGVDSVLIHVQNNSPYRVYDRETETMSASRGLLLKDRENVNRGILLTTGNVNDTYVEPHKMGTPKAIEIETVRDDLDTGIEQYAEQILKLTKLDWNTLHTEVREPITVKYARRAARLASVIQFEPIYDIRDLM